MFFKMLRFLSYLVWFALLTLVTQVGGVVWLVWLTIYHFLIKAKWQGWKRRLAFYSGFVGFYLLSTFTIIPFLAQQGGREPLPVWEEQGLQPLNLGTVLLNRHYVKPKLKVALLTASQTMHGNNPGTVTSYLDANFPFWDGFPLLPHLSHSDGKKVDIVFYYKDAQTGKMLEGTAPSWIGYGVFEDPKPGEQDQPRTCLDKGFWQYGFMAYLIPQGKKTTMAFDAKRTKALVDLLTREAVVGKIFIEPHLKQRLHLTSPKIRYHGCQAVRHDDHIHVQLR